MAAGDAAAEPGPFGGDGSLGGGVAGAWSAPMLTGRPPEARGGHSSCLVGQLVVFFGGHYYGGGDKFVYLNDTWALDVDTLTWHKPKCGGRSPGKRYGHSATAVDYKMYVFGGKGEKGLVFNDLHCLDIERWSWSLMPSTTAPPLGRFGHSMVAVEDTLVLIGGWDGTTAFNDLWTFSLQSMTWLKPQVAGPPPRPRHGHTTIVGPDGGLLVFGGWGINEKRHPVYLNDTCRFDPDDMLWERVGPAGVPPSGRYGHTSVLVGDKMVVFGGWGKGFAKAIEAGKAVKGSGDARTGATSDQLWVLDLAPAGGGENGSGMQWLQPAMLGPGDGRRYGHTAEAIGPFLLVFGGWDGVKSKNDITQMDFTPLVGHLFEESAEPEPEPQGEAGVDGGGEDLAE